MGGQAGEDYAASMNKAVPLLMVAAWSFFATLQAHAQSEYQWVFRGTRYQQSSDGRLVGTPFTEKTMLQEALAAGGITDASPYAVVYHVAGSSFGDTVDIVYRTNGVAVKTLYGFFFGQDFGRILLANAEGTQEKRLDYIYTDQNSHSLGSAFITKRIMPDKKGTRRVVLEGQMQWVVQPQGNIPAQICVGRFSTGKTLF